MIRKNDPQIHSVRVILSLHCGPENNRYTKNTGRDLMEGGWGGSRPTIDRMARALTDTGRCPQKAGGGHMGGTQPLTPEHTPNFFLVHNYTK